MLKHKHYLQNRYRHKRTEEDRLNLRTWHKIIQREFNQHRSNKWNQFISNIASPNPSTFWKTVKSLNKKRSIQFSAISDDKYTHNDPVQILSHLTVHWKSRFTPRITDMNCQTDKEAQELWVAFSKTDHIDTQQACQNSDLKFSPEDIRDVIRGMNSKSSSGFDRISNKMINRLPAVYTHILAPQYNALFSSAYWKWMTIHNILLWQQSGARTNQSTISRVNHLLEQLTSSLRYNTFTSVLFIDFKQAFDMLWQQGLLLNLNRLMCPTPYLLWITNYFKDRTMTIDLNGLLSYNITIERGAPQGSVFGAIAYIVAHHDLQQIFERPENNHLYVDDLGSIYDPNIYFKFQQQNIDIEHRMNKDLEKLHNYTKQWHQSINGNKNSGCSIHAYCQTS
ncbi:unnamed protein product [Rotaria magnacalcarata]|uniref:Reverse transcriptase domain-containing protein n=2 Tax=Rotaria magnacalcarata TaxID=392030 RepID=A0A816M944_9BILA|nr:unnamed protein product [Rotaria magnacalcarata]